MERRSYLQTVGATGLASVAGCLDGILEGEDRAEGAVLGPPELDLGDSVHPTYGDEIPSFSVPDPFADEEITDDQFRGERSLLMTFFLTNCPSNLCPALLQLLNAGKQDAREEGYEDDVAFLAMTFDPERDTPDVLETEADNVGVDPHADNWHFLRPDDNDEAYELVTTEHPMGFGTPVHLEDHDHDGEHDDDHDGEHDDGHDGNESGEDQDDDGIGDTHFYLLLLVNEDGIVERAYPNATEHSASDVVDDLRTVVEG